MAVYSGETIGPTFGGYITNTIDFNKSCIWVSVINLVYASFYFISTRKQIFEDVLGEEKNKNDSLDYFGIRNQLIKENKNMLKF